MSKFIKVTGKLSGRSYLQNMSSVESISDNEMVMKCGSFFDIKETVKQIEAQLLRDEFAMRAMSAIIASGSIYQKWEHLSLDAYALADAMLKERLK